MKLREFQCTLWVPLPPERVFPCFADAANLDLITPQWLRFRIVLPRTIQFRLAALRKQFKVGQCAA